MSQTKATLLLEHHLKALRLPTVLREYAGQAEACAKERVDYPGYLLRLVERELLDRERRAADRRLRDAHFPVVKTIDSFDFSAQPGINEALYRELLRGEYVENRENVLLIGNQGTGKTHLATALGFAACAQGRRVRFHTVVSNSLRRSETAMPWPMMPVPRTVTCAVLVMAPASSLGSDDASGRARRRRPTHGRTRPPGRRAKR